MQFNRDTRGYFSLFLLFTLVSGCEATIREAGKPSSSTGTTAPSYLTLRADSTGIVPGACEALTLTFNKDFPAAPTQVSLSFYEGLGSLFADSACSAPLTSLTAYAFATIKIYVRSSDVHAIAIKASAPGIQDSYTVVPSRSTGIQPASVWGQPSLTRNLHLERGFNGPLGVAVAGTKLYVNDYSNHRILVWNSIPTSNYTQPDSVLGQDSLDIAERDPGGVSAKTLLYPYGLHSDGTKLVVADYNHARVKIWNSPPTANAPADVVVGQPAFNLNFTNYVSLTASTMSRPVGVKLIAGKLVITDCSNHRVMIYNSVPTSNFAAADVILGQQNATSAGANNGGLSPSTMNCPYDAEWDGNYFYVSDGGNHRVLVWNGFPNTTGQAATIVLGQASLTANTANSGGVSATSLYSPQALLVKGTKLFVNDANNNRVLAYDISSAPTTNQAAVMVLGKPDFTTTAAANPPTSSDTSTIVRMAASGTKLIAADYSNNRVLIWNNPTTNGQAADVVLGQPDFVTNKANNGSVSGTLAEGLYGIGTDGTRVAITSITENRVLLWNSKTNYFAGAAADVILGQTTTSGRLANAGGISAGTLRSPTDVQFYGTKLIVADEGNHRVLIWNTIPTSNGQAADVVLGQPNATSASANNGGLTVGMQYPYRVAVDGSGNLYVADYYNHRIIGYSGIPTVTGTAAAFAIGQASTSTNSSGNGLGQMYRPSSVRFAGSKLLVADQGNNRVLVWNTAPNTSGVSANLSFGLMTNDVGLSGKSMTNPFDIAYDGTNLYVADYGDKRVLVYNGVPTTQGQYATRVLGRPHFMQNRSYPPAIDDRLEVPTGITLIGTTLAVVDSTRNRVLHYDTSAFNSFSGATLSDTITRVIPSTTVQAAQRAAMTGSYATCAAVKTAYPDATDGDYLLALDTNNPTIKQSVHCDMTNGGYMEIIHGGDTPLSQLALFGDINDIGSTFLGDSEYGVSWGAAYPTGGSNPWPAVQKCYHVNKTGGAITRVKVKLSARDDADPVNGSYGYMEILNENLGWANYSAMATDMNARGLLYFFDAWGWSYNVGNNALTTYRDIPQSFSTRDGQIQGFTVETNYSANELYICAGGEGATYNRRYVSGLWVK